MSTRASLLSVAAVTIVLAARPPAPARAGDARATGTCGRGVTAQLRLQSGDGGIRVEFEVDSNRGGERWRVVLVHERRVAWRGRVRTRSGSGAFRVRRVVPDFDGVDEVTARASRGDGNTCQATARLTASS